MTDAEWRDIKDRFEAARNATPETRARLIDQVSDPGLRAELASLLEASDHTDDFLETPALLQNDGLPAANSRLGNYSLEKQIGEGGMGVVYEGSRADGEFEQRVAIKVMKRSFAGNRDLLRFRAERQILARLEHSNIARLIDGGKTAEGLPYLVMEFVEGIPLDEYCNGREFDASARLKIFREICDAVEYAHEQNVIHRDLKPANILVASDGRPKLLDFGIAKLVEPGEAPAVTATQYRPVTPQYASPEQLRGEPTTRASDIYSLGVVLYELLTGKRPERAAQRLLAPSELTGTRSWRRSLDRIVLKALADRPEDRYPTVAELAADVVRFLEGRPVQAPRVAGQARAGGRERWILALASIAMLGGAGWLVYSRNAEKWHPRPAIAIFSFQNLAGGEDLNWVAAALQEAVAAEVAASTRNRLIPTQTVTRVESDLGLKPAGFDDARVLERLRKGLGADYLITGSYFASAGQAEAPVRLYARLQNARTGQTVAAANATGTLNELPALTYRTIGTLSQQAGWTAPAGNSAAGMLSGKEFAKLYAEGLVRQRRFEWRAARDLFTRAVKIDPANPLAHSALSGTLGALGFERLAQQEAKSAYDSAAGLSREDASFIEGKYREAMSDWPRAMETYQRLWTIYFDNPEFGLRLARAQSRGGRPVEALQTLQVLTNTPLDEVSAARANLEEARTLGDQSKYAGQLAAAERARAAMALVGARELTPEMFLQEGDALRGLNRFDEALKAYRAGESAAKADGNLYAVASMENRIGTLAFAQGDFVTFEAAASQASAHFEELGNKTAQASTLSNLAIISKMRGDLKRSLVLLEKAVAIDREAGDAYALSKTLTNYGITLRHLDRQEDARRAFEEALACAEQVGDRQQVARSQITLEQLDRDEGNLEAAVKHVEAALQMLEAGPPSSLQSLSWQHLADDLHSRGDLGRAKDALQRSAAMAKQTKADQLVADDSYMLAEIAVEQGEFQQATERLKVANAYYSSQKQKIKLADASLTSIRLQLAQGKVESSAQAEAAVAAYHGSSEDAREVQGDAVLAEVYLALQRPGDAGRVMADGRKVARRIHEFDARMLFQIREGQVASALGDKATASRTLQAALRELQAKGWIEPAMECRLLLAQVHGAAVREAELARLVEDAERQGFQVIAQRARGSAVNLTAEKPRRGVSPRK